ncbi:MAG: hypothetical protein D9N11_02975 [Ketobacter sp.]|nr:MAG: hypothetical protein D9N11_02975 [Ketobacter sp.]
MVTVFKSLPVMLISVALLSACCSKPDDESIERLSIALEQPISVPNEFIIEVEAGFDPEQLPALLQESALQWEWIGAQENNLLLLKFPEQTEEAAAISRLRGLEGVKQVEPNYLMQPMQPIGN